ncbi:hypothetical protein VAPA_1c10650 [Variovorax paradoxus B4]|uniref:Uncharacterized protein n=1 Tax=Variovorax paradoxus B4 TaxID=1246301 RepID=T1X796_VARPD|nr:DUF938 domain-containing protein [Variovorax paradoxus]AGU48184.1 hypothetical protein VAPA_1c10650 [Variovorax paradoxus B4]
MRGRFKASFSTQSAEPGSLAPANDSPLSLQPVLNALARILGKRGTALESASGAGQRGAWFASEMPQWTWQPTDADGRMCRLMQGAARHLLLIRPP